MKEAADEEKGGFARLDAENPGTVMVPNTFADTGPRFKDQLQSQIGEHRQSSQHDGTVVSALSNSHWEEAGAVTADVDNDDDRSSHNPIPTRQKPIPAPTRTTRVSERVVDNESMPVLQAVPVEDAVEIPQADVQVMMPTAIEESSGRSRKDRSMVRCLILSTAILAVVFAAGIGILCGITDVCGRSDNFEVFATQQDLYTAIDTYWTAMSVSTVDDRAIPSTAVEDVIRRYGPIEEWKVDQIANFSHMVSSQRNPVVAAAFDADLSQWDVRSATDFSFMFFDASNFSSTTDLTGWDTSRVTTMQSMFHRASKFNGNVTTWNVGKVTNFARMFSDVWRFNQDISGWDMRKAIDCKWMFFENLAFDQNLSAWDTRNNEDFSYMFRGATSFNSDLSRWVTRRSYKFHEMFRDATSFNQDLSKWVFNMEGFEGEVFNMTQMFAGATNYNQSLCDWRAKIPMVNVSVNDMFLGASLCESTQDPVLLEEGAWTGPFCQLCV